MLYCDQNRRTTTKLLSTMLAALLCLGGATASHGQSSWSQSAQPKKEKKKKQINKPPLWRVKHKGGTTFIFATIGSRPRPKLFYLFPKYVIGALAESSSLVVEVDPRVNLQQIQKVLATHASLPNNTQLTQYLDPQLQQMVQKFSYDYFMQPAAFMRRMPWVATMMMLHARFHMMEMAQPQHYDYLLAEIAIPTGKPMRSLYSFEDVAKAMSRVDIPSQVAMLRKTLIKHSGPLDRDPQIIFASAWNASIITKLRAILNQPPTNGAEVFYKKHTAKIAKEVATKISGIIKSGGGAFVSLSLPTVISDGGVLQLLEKMGYTVEIYNPYNKKWQTPTLTLRHS